MPQKTCMHDAKATQKEHHGGMEGCSGRQIGRGGAAMCVGEMACRYRPDVAVCRRMGMLASATAAGDA